MSTRTASVAAPAKVNLWLRIMAREASGYHSLETLFQALQHGDEVTVFAKAEGGIELVVTGNTETGPPERNLCARAAGAYAEALGEPLHCRIELTKRLPAAAGLGGGSSDAAATLRALDALHGDALGRDRLLQIGIGLGADVPFFLCGSPLALAWGRGERLLPLRPLRARPVLIAHPGEPLSTADAFARLAEGRGEYTPEAGVLRVDDLRAWADVAARAENQFEPLADEQMPRLAEGRRALREAGAQIALLAGSGASLFGIFTEDAARDAAEPRLERLGFRCWRTATAHAVPGVRLG